MAGICFLAFVLELLPILRMERRQSNNKKDSLVISAFILHVGCVILGKYCSFPIQYLLPERRTKPTSSVSKSGMLMVCYLTESRLAFGNTKPFRSISEVQLVNHLSKYCHMPVASISLRTNHNTPSHVLIRDNHNCSPPPPLGDKLAKKGEKKIPGKTKESAKNSSI
jgi:hypothetical protein